MYSKILVPVDGSEASTAGLHEAIQIAKINGSQIQLIHIVNEFFLDYTYSSGMYATEVFEQLRKGGQAILDQAEDLVRRQGLTPETVLIENIGGRACDLILKQSDKWHADLIVMGTHGRRGLARMAMGSDAELVVRSASVPVLLVRVARPAKATQGAVEKARPAPV
jgi:nucleotide-binding universal stress UspA family protein